MSSIRCLLTRLPDPCYWCRWIGSDGARSTFTSILPSRCAQIMASTRIQAPAPSDCASSAATTPIRFLFCVGRHPCLVFLFPCSAPSGSCLRTSRQSACRRDWRRQAGSKRPTPGTVGHLLSDCGSMSMVNDPAIACGARVGSASSLQRCPNRPHGVSGRLFDVRSSPATPIRRRCTFRVVPAADARICAAVVGHDGPHARPAPARRPRRLPGRLSASLPSLTYI